MVTYTTPKGTKPHTRGFKKPILSLRQYASGHAVTVLNVCLGISGTYTVGSPTLRIKKDRPALRMRSDLIELPGGYVILVSNDLTCLIGHVDGEYFEIQPWVMDLSCELASKTLDASYYIKMEGKNYRASMRVGKVKRAAITTHLLDDDCSGIAELDSLRKNTLLEEISIDVQAWLQYFHEENKQFDAEGTILAPVLCRAHIPPLSNKIQRHLQGFAEMMNLNGEKPGGIVGCALNAKHTPQNDFAPRFKLEFFGPLISTLEDDSTYLRKQVHQLTTMALHKDYFPGDVNEVVIRLSTKKNGSPGRTYARVVFPTPSDLSAHERIGLLSKLQEIRKRPDWASSSSEQNPKT